MHFSLDQSIKILERTPSVLNSLLYHADSALVMANEGTDTWSTYDIIGHLIHGEQTDWMIRIKIILSEVADKKFEVFDRFAQFNNSNGKTLQQLLNEFTALRAKNIAELISINQKDEDLIKTGIHPEFGVVSLSQLIATWVVHDFNHIAQICRVMSKQYKEEVGPWSAYLGILK